MLVGDLLLPIASAGAGSLTSPDPARDSASMRFTASLLSAAASAAIRLSPARSTCGTRRSSASMSSRSVAMISADVETAVVSLGFIWPCLVDRDRRRRRRIGRGARLVAV